jgi:hypothetical protein
MKLRIHAVKITLATNKGQFGSLALFDSGLNVIRAENTSGKSTLINSILYALGLEILIGKRGIEATKPVLWSLGEYQGKEFNVVESFVELELSNESGTTITVRRYVAGQKDSRSVEVIFGPLVTCPAGSEYRVEPFFVGVEGAAQRQRGFHYFLAEFVKLDLPYVKRFAGEDVPLYVECVAPLMFIEQVRGWSGIQATLPQTFGIRNVAKLAVEYLLNLDVIENEKRRIQLSDEASQIREEWKSVRESMARSAALLGGRIMNVPGMPVSVLPDEPWVSVFLNKENTTPLPDLLLARRSLFLEKSGEDKNKTEGKEDLEAKLKIQEKSLLIEQAGLSQLRLDIRYEEDALKQLRDRIEFVRADIQRNKDIKRLRDYGVETELSVVGNRCPTCNQTVQDSLLPTESAVMGIEENINFLKAEADAIELLISAGEERLARLQGVEIGKAQTVANLRTTIRDLRSDLLQSQNLSFAVIREQVHLQEEITRLEQLQEDFERQVGRIKEIVDRWQNNRSRVSELPRDYFSQQDRVKLKALSEHFAMNVTSFGYRSTEISRLHISEDNYRPVCDEFEIAFGASASDNVRLIWAYTLALLQVSLDFGGQHWGVIIFDEPEQQTMKQASSDALYAKIASMPSDQFQVIIATSASLHITENRLKKLRHNLLEFGDKVIRPTD